MDPAQAATPGNNQKVSIFQPRVNELIGLFPAGKITCC